MEDADIATVTQLCRNFLLGASLVADQTDDQVLGVFGEVLDELELGCIRQRPYT